MDMLAAKDMAAKAGALALLLFGGAALAQGQPAIQTAPAQPASESTPAAPPKISYEGGQLRIDALNSTLAEVLAKVASLTGVNIDVPAGASGERMPVVELGPGPARQVLASLLSDTDFDYLIQAADGAPEKIQSVLVMAREKKGAGAATAEAAARSPRGAFGRPGGAPARVEEEAPPPASEASEAISAVPQTAAVQPDQTAPPSSPMPDVSGQFPQLQPDTTNPAKPGALAPPQSLNTDSINLQLQQMYQQRAQMTQQDHYTGTQPVPVIPGAK
jgi:hypothetical protein